MTFAARIDWGNVPQWVAGVLTGGSLILGFYIVLRDRRKAEREQAEQVVVSPTLVVRTGKDAGNDGGQRDEVTIYIHNTSLRPIREPTFIARGRPPKDIIRDLQQDGGQQGRPWRDELIQTLRGMDKIDPQRHEGWLLPDPEQPIRVIPADGQKTMIINPPLLSFCYRFEFSFLDAKGIYWIYDVALPDVGSVPRRGLWRPKGQSWLKRWPRQAWRRIRGLSPWLS